MEPIKGMKQIFFIFGAIVLAVAILFSISFLLKKDEVVDDTKNDLPKSGFKSFEVERPFFVIESSGFESVAIYGVPTGTDIKDSSHVAIATTTLATEKNNEQIWKGMIPNEPILLSEIYAVAVDSLGNKSERYYFPLKGASDIYNALWFETPSEVLELLLKDTKEVNGIKFELTKIISDSRCGVDINCISAGSVKIEVMAKAYGKEEKITLDSMDKESVSVFGQKITFKKVLPERGKSQSIIKDSEYRIFLLVEQESKE